MMNWAKAQDITFSVDLIDAAKQQLRFLAAVDTTQSLYDGPTLDRAIYRYKNCWLPLLEKHMNCPVFSGPLVVPLDCEWIWHCHRLNPIQYKQDCEKVFGKILDNSNVVSSIEEFSSKETEALWKRIYITEPYNLDLANVESQLVTDEPYVKPQRDITIEYDLVGTVKRLSCFFSKISKMMSKGDDFFEEALARYKAFIYLAKIKVERQVEVMCVPTRDIDLMWHSHQLHPAAYCKDMKAVVGKVLDHNDRDDFMSSKGQKLMQLRFVQTQKLWEDIYMCPLNDEPAHDQDTAITEKGPEGQCFFGCLLCSDIKS